MFSVSASNYSEREQIMMGIIAFLVAWGLMVSVWYWNTGDDYEPAYREGYCAAQGAEYVKPNLCMNGDRVVSVWTK